MLENINAFDAYSPSESEKSAVLRNIDDCQANEVLARARYSPSPQKSLARLVSRRDAFCEADTDGLFHEATRKSSAGTRALKLITSGLAVPFTTKMPLDSSSASLYVTIPCDYTRPSAMSLRPIG
jgi:hypothetical protein